MKISAFIILFCAFFAISAKGQSAAHNIKGVWRYYESVTDTTDKGEGGLYLMFSDTSVAMLSAMDGMLTPIGGEEKYTFKNDSLTTFPQAGVTKVKVTFLTSDLISYLDPAENKLLLYLKRQKK